MSSTKILIIVLFLAVQSYTQNPKKCCTAYDKSDLICLSCPEGTYYYGNNCIPDIDNCADFEECGLCSKCASGYNLVDSQSAGRKIKKCQELSSYIPIDLDKKTEQGPSYDAYIISDDYMKNIHKELKPGKPLSAYHKSSPGGIQLIKIQYEVMQSDGQNRKFYRTTMQIDLTKYEFKEIDFGEIDKTDLGNIKSESNDVSVVKNKEKVSINTSGGIGETSINGQYLQKVLDLREQNNLKIVQAVDVIVRGANLIFKKVVSVKIKTINSGKQFIEITYLANDDTNHVFLIQAASRRVINVDGQAVSSRVVSQPVKQAPAETIITVPPIMTSALPDNAQVKTIDASNKKQTIVSSPPLVTVGPISAPAPAPASAPAPKSIDLNTNKQQPNSNPSASNPTVPASISTQTPSTQPNLPPVAQAPASPKTTPAGPDPQTGIWPKEPIAGYIKQDNIEVLKDLKFLVAKDLLNKKLKGYQDILPTNCYSKIEGNTKIFLMLFNRLEEVTETIVKVNSISYATELIYEHKVGIVQKQPTASTQSRTYTPKDIPQVIKTSYFISAAIQVSKAPNGYTSDNMISVAVNDDDPNTIYYRAVYNVGGKLYQVESLTKKKLRIGQLVSEKDITPPGAVINLVKPKPETKPQNTNVASSSGDQSTQSTSASTSITPAVTVVQPTPVTNLNPPLSASSSASLSNSAPPATQATSTPVQDVKPTAPGVSNVKPQSNSSDKPSPPTKQAIQPEKTPVVKTPATPTPTPTCEFPKITPKFDQLLKFSPNTELPQCILTQIGGFSQLFENPARTDVNYLKIQSFVECTSWKIIKDSQILGVFSKGIGFASQFKIYYETPKKVIYQVFVTIDRIKSKIYIINFNPISFGVQ